jgi:hypothetical protein
MLGEATLTFKEFMMGEELPLATIQDAILEFLRGRDDVVLFGAQAVNAYVDEPRMSQDVDLLSDRAAELAEELRAHLGTLFHVSIRTREVGAGSGYRLYQVRKPKNRHLVDVRSVDELPEAQRLAGIRVMTPVELIASKVLALHHRRGQPKSGTDWRDLAMLLLTFPELKRHPGPVTEKLVASHAVADELATWTELVRQELQPEDEDSGF